MTPSVIAPANRMQSRSATISDRKSTAAFIPTTIFVLSTFFQRLGYWFSGFPLPIAMLLSPMILAFGYFKGRVELLSNRATLFVFLAGCIMVSTLLGTRGTTTSTIAYLLLYAQWLFCCPMNREEYTNFLHKIAFLTSVLCILGMLQYLSQYFIKSTYIFSWRGLVPPDFLIEQNTLNELTYDSGQYKGNGFFLSEPSSLSGLAARVLLLTVLILKDLRYAVPLALGLIFSLSGSGLVFTLLFTAVPLGYLLFEHAAHAIKTPPFFRISLAVSGAIVTGLLFLHYSDYFIGRLDELSDPHASGYARYTTAIFIFKEHMLRSMDAFLFGYGPGSFDPLTGQKHSTGWIKLFMELGLVGTIAFVAFFLACVYSSTRSWYISLAVLFHYLVIDSPVLSPQFVLLAFSLFALPVLKEADSQRGDERTWPRHGGVGFLGR